jgi:hypothetical protein
MGVGRQGSFGRWRRKAHGFPSFPSTTPLGNFFGGVAVGVSELTGAAGGSRVSSAIFSYAIEMPWRACVRFEVWGNCWKVKLRNAPAFAASTGALSIERHRSTSPLLQIFTMY